MASKKTWNQKLNPQQIAFCQYYVKEEFFCNGTQAYKKAYNVEDESARRLGSLLLTNIDILDYIDSLLTDMALNDQRVDKELAKLILQDEEKGVKLNAIKEYNTLRARIEKGRQNAINKGEISTDAINKLDSLTR